MKYIEPGTYELPYSAVDECGNTTTEVRTIIVNETENLFAYGQNKGIPWYDPSLELDQAYIAKTITSATIDLRIAVEGVRCVVGGTTYTPTWEDAEVALVFNDDYDTYEGTANWQIPNSTSKVGIHVVMDASQHTVGTSLDLVDDDERTEVYFADVKVYIKGE